LTFFALGFAFAAGFGGVGGVSGGSGVFAACSAATSGGSSATIFPSSPIGSAPKIKAA
jgi:hypothetical protein